MEYDLSGDFTDSPADRNFTKADIWAYLVLVRLYI